MLDVRFRPLDKWPENTPLGKRHAHFKTPFNRTLDMIEYELRKLGATEILIEAGFTLPDLRNDGWPRGGAEPSHPGVILYFKSKEGPMRFPCGTYSTWRDNLHALALTLENLRAIDRYGVTLGHQQYLGFRALPPATTKFATLEDAAQFLEIQCGGLATLSPILDSPDSYRSAYREAARRLHPDNASGNQHLWNLLTEAKTLLDQHHGVGGGARS